MGGRPSTRSPAARPNNSSLLVSLQAAHGAGPESSEHHPRNDAGEELRAAVEEWQAKRSAASGAPRLTTGFLDGTHPIVDAYELKVHCQHLHARYCC